MTKKVVAQLSYPTPIVAIRQNPTFVKVCVCAHVEGHTRPKGEYLLLHLNKVTVQYESNIVTYDTSNRGAYWRDEGGMVSATTGFAIAFLGWNDFEMQGSAYVAAEITIGMNGLRNRMATGTSYTDTDKLENRQHNRRYLSQIGGKGPVLTVPVTEINFSTFAGTAFEIVSASAIAL